MQHKTVVNWAGNAQISNGALGSQHMASPPHALVHLLRLSPAQSTGALTLIGTYYINIYSGYETLFWSPKQEDHMGRPHLRCKCEYNRSYVIRVMWLNNVSWTLVGSQWWCGTSRIQETSSPITNQSSLVTDHSHHTSLFWIPDPSAAYPPKPSLDMTSLLTYSNYTLDHC